MRERIDIVTLISGIAATQKQSRVSDAIAVMTALERLRKVRGLPMAYVDGIQDELLQFIGQPAPKEAMTSVYLAFHGLDERAAFMKVGVACDVKKRMRELYTGNPMPRLWTFEAGFQSRAMAYRVESALHMHLRHSSTSGEWFQVHGLSDEASAMFAASLAEVAQSEVNRPVEFLRVGM